MVLPEKFDIYEEFVGTTIGKPVDFKRIFRCRIIPIEPKRDKLVVLRGILPYLGKKVDLFESTWVNSDLVIKACDVESYLAKFNELNQNKCHISYIREHFIQILEDGSSLRVPEPDDYDFCVWRIQSNWN